MPLIEGRKNPENIQFVTADEWELMKQKGLDRRYKVQDDNDIQQTVIPAPESFVDFSQQEKTESPVAETVEPILERQEIKDKLDDLEIEYNTRASTENLLKLLNNQ